MRGYSTIPRVRRRLHELLVARPGLANVGVHRGHPGREARDELVLIGRVDTPEQDPSAIGQRGRDERYIIDVLFDVFSRDDAPEDVEDRAFLLLRELEALLRDDPSLGGAFPAGNGHAQLDGMTVETAEVDDDRVGVGYSTLIVARVGVWARI
jgi:hypothetical protein